MTGALGTLQSATWSWSGGTSVIAAIVAFTPGAPVPVTVPDVVGETEAAADTLIVAAGLVTGTVTTATSETVAMGDVISQSPTAGASVAPGSAVDLVISAGPAEWKVLVDGVNQTASVTACSIQWTLNERTRATIVFNDYLPDRLAEVIVYARDGITKLFGGPILSRHVQGYTQRGPDLKVTCECGEYFSYADWVTVSAAYAESTLKARLTAIVTDYLSAYGITLDVAQVDGPTVAAVTWNQKRVSDALRELSNQSGYFLQMSPDKVLTMAPPGDADAPYDWTDTLPTHVQEVDWRDLETVPANKVILTCGPNGLATIADEHHWGDGIRGSSRSTRRTSRSLGHRGRAPIQEGSIRAASRWGPTAWTICRGRTTRPSMRCASASINRFWRLTSTSCSGTRHSSRLRSRPTRARRR